MQRFQFLKLAAAAVIAVPLLLSGCGDKKSTELKVGATAGPHAANVQKAAEVAKQQGLPRLVAARLKKHESRSPTRGCGFHSFFR